MFTPLTFCYSTCQCTTPKNTRVDPDVPRVFHCTHARLSSSFHLLRVRLILPDWELFFFFLIYTLQREIKKKWQAEKKKALVFLTRPSKKIKLRRQIIAIKMRKKLFPFISNAQDCRDASWGFGFRGDEIGFLCSCYFRTPIFFFFFLHVLRLLPSIDFSPSRVTPPELDLPHSLVQHPFTGSLPSDCRSSLFLRFRPREPSSRAQVSGR